MSNERKVSAIGHRNLLAHSTLVSTFGVFILNTPSGYIDLSVPTITGFLNFAFGKFINRKLDWPNVNQQKYLEYCMNKS